MSKAFTKEDGSGAPELPPEEAWPLAPGEKNYMTPTSAAQLKAELEMLESPAAKPSASSQEERLLRERRVRGLKRRLESAEIIDPLTQPRDRVLFGATVSVVDDAEVEHTYRIVGIDAADAKNGRLSWRSPIARALLNRKVGDVVSVTTPGGAREVEIVSIRYEAG